MLEGHTRILEWGDVEGWAEDGGAELGTRRTIPSIDQYYALSRAIENAELDALIVIGGFKGYKMAFDMGQEKIAILVSIFQLCAYQLRLIIIFLVRSIPLVPTPH